MYEVRFSQGAEIKKQRPMKLRKGRLILFIAFISFIIIDLFLITEYKARGANAVSFQIMQKVAEVFDSGTNLVSSIWKPRFKQDNNFTSALIVGVDTRHAEFTGSSYINPVDPEEHAGNLNTDVVIQMVYDHNNGNIFMVSIPRDMGVDVRKECLDFHGSLHWVFDKAESANCPGGGAQTLAETVASVTGIPVHYYAFVSFDVFVDIINTVGETNENGEHGIWIDIPEPVYELYPIESGGWESIYFPAGHQFLTAERALKFARSRKASSDFARSQRQQMVIGAVKERVRSSETLLNPKKVYDLVKIFRTKALISDVNLEEIRGALNIARDLDEAEIAHVVLDPNLGGYEVYLNKIPHDRRGRYYMVPTHWRECPGNEFCQVHQFLKQIIENPEVYQEEAKIYVYARSYKSGEPDLDNRKYQNFKDKRSPIKLRESRYTAKIPGDNDIVIFDFTEGSKPHTMKLLSEELGAEIVPGNQAPSNVRLNKEDVTIVVKGN